MCALSLVPAPVGTFSTWFNRFYNLLTCVSCAGNTKRNVQCQVKGLHD